MLDGVHCQPTEGFNVSVSVMQRMNEGIKWLDMQESMHEIEMDVSSNTDDYDRNNNGEERIFLNV